MESLPEAAATAVASVPQSTAVTLESTSISPPTNPTLPLILLFIGMIFFACALIATGRWMPNNTALPTSLGTLLGTCAGAFFRHIT